MQHQPILHSAGKGFVNEAEIQMCTVTVGGLHFMKDEELGFSMTLTRLLLHLLPIWLAIIR